MVTATKTGTNILRIITDIKKLRNQVEQANKAKNEFLSCLSHEIRTPLNAIDGFSQLILEEKDIQLIIKDRYKLLDFNITKERIEDGERDFLISTLENLKQAQNIIESGIK